MDVSEKSKGLFISLMIIQIFNGLSGVLGGYMLITDPTGSSLNIPVGWLAGTPFNSYLIPGIVLFILNGIGNLGGAYFTIKHYRRAAEVAIIFGVIMMVWIISQVSFIGFRSFLQPLYFLTGLAQASVGLWICR
jgi:hypothetical protein